MRHWMRSEISHQFFLLGCNVAGGVAFAAMGRAGIPRVGKVGALDGDMHLLKPDPSLGKL